MPRVELAPLPEHPVVSVLMTAYNYAHFLPAAIDSALAQRYPADRLEVIVVDDGSTDATPEVIAGYGDRIRAIRRPNGGLRAATQTALDAATGDVLAILDADDIWPADRTTAVVEAFRAHPAAGLVWGDMEIIGEHAETLAPSYNAACGLQGQPPTYGRLLLGNLVTASSLAFRRELVPFVTPMPPEARLQDWWFASQIARVADVVPIDDVVCRYRNHGSNMVMGADDAQRVKLLAAELPFRRLLLRSAVPGEAALDEWLLAVKNLDGIVAINAQVLGTDAPTVLGLTEADRAAHHDAMHRASAHLDDGALEAAFCALIVAVGCDPTDPEARELTMALRPLVEQGAALTAAA